jgi:putative transposase
VIQARQRFGVSERRACRVLHQPRATQRRALQVPEDEPRLVADMTTLAQRYGRYGYRRIAALLEPVGWHLNHKRIERLWRREGLRVPAKQPKRGRLWLNDGSCVRLRPLWKDHVWAYDFVDDRTHDGRKLRLLVVVDEFTRECLAIDVGRRMTSEDVLERLTFLFITRGVPDYIRSDNGGEFTAKVVREWLAKVGVKTLFIDPASPWENGYCESFNGKLQDELLKREIFYTLLEAKVLIERWRVHYNTQRPHSALGYRPPAPAAVAWSAIASAGDILGAPPQTPPGAPPLDPGFFPLSGRPESKLGANGLTLEVVS